MSSGYDNSLEHLKISRNVLNADAEDRVHICNGNAILSNGRNYGLNRLLDYP